MNRAPVVIDYYSDLLCVWAYVAQVRVDEIQQEFGEKVIINHHFFSLFGDTTTRLEVGWKDRGGFSGFHDHVAAVEPHVGARLGFHRVVVRRVLQPHLRRVIVLAAGEQGFPVAGEEAERHAARTVVPDSRDCK